jgi:hypothetical protein
MLAMENIVRHPLGLGLGSAGPASNRTSDACVFLSADGDASWAEGHPELCVFLGETQVLPLDRVCTCPFLTENWYLQIGVEMGIAGFLLFFLLIICILLQLARKKNVLLHYSTFFAFLGVSIAALFLHAWEDSAVAYTLWILTAASLAQAPGRVFSGGTTS